MNPKNINFTSLLALSKGDFEKKIADLIDNSSKNDLRQIFSNAIEFKLDNHVNPVSNEDWANKLNYITQDVDEAIATKEPTTDDLAILEQYLKINFQWKKLSLVYPSAFKDVFLTLEGESVDLEDFKRKWEAFCLVFDAPLLSTKLEVIKNNDIFHVVFSLFSNIIEKYPNCAYCESKKGNITIPDFNQMMIAVVNDSVKERVSKGLKKTKEKVFKKSWKEVQVLLKKEFAEKIQELVRKILSENPDIDDDDLIEIFTHAMKKTRKRISMLQQRNLRPIYDKYNRKIEYLMNSMFKFVDENMRLTVTAHEKTWEYILSLFEGEIIEIVDVMHFIGGVQLIEVKPRYTMNDLRVDVEGEFGTQITSLITKMLNSGDYTKEDVYEVLSRYVDKASSRVLASYRDIPPLNVKSKIAPLDQKFSREINIILEKMLVYAATQWGASTYNIRVKIWRIIDDLLKETIFSTESKIDNLYSFFVDKYSDDFKEALMQIKEAIKLTIEDFDLKGDLNQITVKAFKLYLKENLDLFLEWKTEFQHESIALTSRNYFEELDNIFTPFYYTMMDKIEPNLEKEDKKEVMRKIFGLAVIYIYEEKKD